MCVSRLHRVLHAPSAAAADVEDMDGRVRSVSLLALDGPAPRAGEWLVVHSGYAIGRAEAADAEEIAASVHAAGRRPR